MYFLRITFKSFKKLNQLTQKLLKLKNINKLKNIDIRVIFQIKKKKKFLPY